jgi:hypothetical protein
MHKIKKMNANHDIVPQTWKLTHFSRLPCLSIQWKSCLQLCSGWPPFIAPWSQPAGLWHHHFPLELNCLLSLNPCLTKSYCISTILRKYFWPILQDMGVFLSLTYTRHRLPLLYAHLKVFNSTLLINCQVWAGSGVSPEIVMGHMLFLD